MAGGDPLRTPPRCRTPLDLSLSLFTLFYISPPGRCAMAREEEKIDSYLESNDDDGGRFERALVRQHPTVRVVGGEYEPIGFAQIGQ